LDLEFVEDEAASSVSARLFARAPPAAAGALQGIRHEVDAHLGDTWATATVENLVAVRVELVRPLAAQVGAPPRRPQVAVLLTFFRTRLVERERLSNHRLDHTALVPEQSVELTLSLPGALHRLALLRLDPFAVQAELGA